MPLYDYLCQNCGPFIEWGEIHDALAPKSCPHCCQESLRTISAARLSVISKQNRRAWEVNEKSAHQPHSVKKEVHVHGPHCNHEHREKRKPIRRGRPWMLGHR